MSSTVNILAQVPDLMKAILDHDENADINMAIEDKHKLSPKQCDAMMAVMREVILQTVEPSRLVAVLQKELELDEPKAKALALDLLGWRFLPMEWYLGPIEPLIRELGGDPKGYIYLIAPIYPEVYGDMLAEMQEAEQSESQSSEQTASAEKQEPTILHSIDDRLTTNKGRAEVLLRLTALSQQIEEAGKAKTLNENEAQELMHSLDTLSYAVNTQDLNPLEIAAIKRRLKNILAKLPSA